MSNLSARELQSHISILSDSVIAVFSGSANSLEIRTKPVNTNLVTNSHNASLNYLRTVEGGWQRGNELSEPRMDVGIAVGIAHKRSNT